MQPLSHVRWGPIDANSPDAKFSEKWIEPPDILSCLDPESWIVSGEKGSGKSAIQRAIREVHAASYFATPLVSFDNLTFKAISDNLVNIANTTKMSRTTTLSNYWQYCIVLEIMKACAEKHADRYRDLIEQIPQNRKTPSEEFNRGLLSLLEEAWNKIDDFTRPQFNRKSPANLLESGGLSADLLHELSVFPLDSDYQAIKSEFFARLKADQHQVVLILDDLDRLKNDTARADAIQLIFDSLADALLSLRADGDWPERLSIKALIPHDRFMGVSLRDSDKMSDISASIRWDRNALEELVIKRIVATTRINESTFDNVWHEVMPPSLRNPHHKVDEDSFDYLLRHTMMRPRQLQIHLDALATRHRNVNIQPTMIPKSVAASSERLARFFIGEFALDRPELERFVLLFGDQDNVMEYKVFRDQVYKGMRRFVVCQEGTTVEELVDDLYAMGLFGIVKFENGKALQQDIYYPPTRESRRHYVEFFYRRPHSKISARLTDDSLIALHPIFVHFANLTPHPTLIIG